MVNLLLTLQQYGNPRTFALVNFCTQGNEKRLNISPPKGAAGGAGKNIDKRALMSFIHVLIVSLFDTIASYCAMANGRGGWVILGVKEHDGEFTPVGVVDPQKIKTDLFNQLNDRDRVSVNVLQSEKDVQLVNLQGSQVLAIHISPARRQRKPVHLKTSPFGNTYQRLHEGDRFCDDMTVKRMLAEQIHDSRDNEVLSEHYAFDEDIDLDSMKAYRNLLSSNNPQHPCLACEPFE